MADISAEARQTYVVCGGPDFPLDRAIHAHMDHETRAVNIPPSPKTPGLRSRGRVRRSETLMHARFIRGRWKYGRVIPHVRSPIVSRLIALSRYTELHSRVTNSHKRAQSTVAVSISSLQKTGAGLFPL